MLAPGDKLPPVRDFAWRLGMTPGTVARAYSTLVDQGVLEATVGRGTFVAQRGPAPDADWPDIVDLRSPELPEVGQTEALRAALRATAEAEDAPLACYPGPETELKARKAVLGWTAEKILGPAAPEDVILAHGGQNAILTMFQTVLSGPRPAILTEDLSYAGFRHAARLARAEVVALTSDEDGVRPDALDAACRAYDAQIFCSTPEAQNPTTRRTSLTRRRELADVARRHNVAILEDDCYALSGGDLPTYRALAPDLGWYVSSVSKTLTPSVRFGYLIAPKTAAEAARRTAQHACFGLSVPITEAMTRLLTTARATGLPTLMRTRIEALVQIAVNELGGFDISWRRDLPFFWLTLPLGWRASAFCRAAEAEGVLLRSADHFTLRDGRAPHAVRIAANGRIDPDCFQAAMGRLAGLLQNPPTEIEV